MAFLRVLPPALFSRCWWDIMDYPSSILDQHFGTGLTDADLCPPTAYRGYVVHPRTQAAVQSSGESQVENEKDKFVVTLSVSHFKLNDLEVKIVDKFLLIHGKHEEMSDEHGLIQREFTRRYILPESTEAETVKSSLGSDGVLTIEAPKKEIEELPPNVFIVPITEYESTPNVETA